MSVSKLSIRIDDDLKSNADKLFKDLGMNISTAVTVFLEQSVRDNQLPFQPSLNSAVSIQARRDATSGTLTKYDTVDEWWDELNAQN